MRYSTLAGWHACLVRLLGREAVADIEKQDTHALESCEYDRRTTLGYPLDSRAVKDKSWQTRLRVLVRHCCGDRVLVLFVQPRLWVSC